MLEGRGSTDDRMYSLYCLRFMGQDDVEIENWIWDGSDSTKLVRVIVFFILALVQWTHVPDWSLSGVP